MVLSLFINLNVIGRIEHETWKEVMNKPGLVEQHQKISHPPCLPTFGTLKDV